MNISRNTMVKAKKIALADKTFEKSLKEWHDSMGTCPDYVPDFSKWVDKMLDYISGCIEDETPENIARALRVNTVGDEFASKTARKAKDEGFSTDTNCYVEDNTVYSNVWISGKSAEENKAKAEDVAEEFRKEGYSAEIWIDEVDDTDVTVNAQMGFPEFAKAGRK